LVSYIFPVFIFKDITKWATWFVSFTFTFSVLTVSVELG
jgi:hypothetical protein